MVQRRVKSKQAMSNKVQHSGVIKRSFDFRLKSRTVSKIVTQRSTIVISPPPNWLPLVLVELGKCPVSRKSQNMTNPRAGSLGGAPNCTNSQFEDKKNPVQRYQNILYISLTATGISMFHMYSQTAVRVRCAAARHNNSVAVGCRGLFPFFRVLRVCQVVLLRWGSSKASGSFVGDVGVGVVCQCMGPLNGEDPHALVTCVLASPPED